MRTALALLLSLALAGGVRAGEGDDVLVRIDSDDPAEVAWGAYLAGAEGRTDAVPALLDVLHRRPEDLTARWERVTLHAVDALIRLDAHVPAEWIPARTRAKHRYACQVLLGKEPDVHGAALLRWFHDSWARKYDTVTKSDIAIGNLLARHPVPGFVAEVLHRMPLTLVVEVREEGVRLRKGRHRHLRAGAGDGRGKVPEGFPPFVWWKLTLSEQPGVAPFADGRVPVWAVRREIADGGGFGESSGNRDSGPLCDEWLAIVLEGDAERVVLDRLRYATITWTGADGYVTEATAARDAFVRAWHDLLFRCLAEGRITREEAQAHAAPHLELEFDDERADKTNPLPELPPTLPALQLPEPAPPPNDDPAAPAADDE